MNLFAVKPVERILAESEVTGEHSLKRSLGPAALIALGIGAIIGAGTFASETAAASATGHGEAIIMASLCREVVEALRTSDPMRIARRKIAELIAPQGREAGVILVDRKGCIGFAHNADTMEVGIFDSTGRLRHEYTAPMPMARKPRK